MYEDQNSGDATSVPDQEVNGASDQGADNNPADDTSSTQDQSQTSDSTAGDGSGDSGAAATDTTASNNVRDPTSTEASAISTAETERASALAKALRLADATLTKRPAEDTDGGSGAPASWSSDDQRVLDTAGRWLYTPQVNGAFWIALAKSRDLMSRNQGLSAQAHVDTTTTDYAHVDEKRELSKGIFFGSLFFRSNANCQREVLTHEYFHFLGLDHYYDTSDTYEALQCAHHLAEFVFDLATGCTSGCRPNATCRP